MVIIADMTIQGHVFNIVLALSCGLVSYICYAFIDDTDDIHSALSVNTPGEEVISEMQGIFDHWGGLLLATGGGLVPKKSYWYGIDFKWDGRRWTYCSQKLTCPVRSSSLVPMGDE